MTLKRKGHMLGKLYMGPAFLLREISNTNQFQELSLSGKQ